MRRLLSVLAGGLLAVTSVGATLAAAPSKELTQFTTDPYVLAECDGYDVMEQDDVSVMSFTYYDKAGNATKTVNHATDTGVAWRSDTAQQLATYSDAGGTFTATSGGIFAFTGILNLWALNDGTRVMDAGRIVVAFVDGGFDVILVAGHLPDRDPCTW